MAQAGLLAIVLFAGCGPDAAPADGMDAGMDRDAGIDAASEDARTLEPDGGATSTDAGTGPGPDGGVPEDDAGPDDGDGDGVPDDADCDPTDSEVGRTGTRECANACGAGYEMCTDGAWGACGAPTDCFCSTPGATRVGACGNCGTQAQECRAGVWTATSACTGEGTCRAGTSETRDGEPYVCAIEQRICQSDCRWGGWTEISRGECIQYTTECSSSPRLNCACSADCRCSPVPGCPY